LYNFPNTKKEWWEIVDKYWIDLFKILNMFIDTSELYEYEGKISSETINQKIIEFKENRNYELVRWLEQAWLNAPDSIDIHSIRGWSILCDLCSEEYVLYLED